MLELKLGKLLLAKYAPTCLVFDKIFLCFFILFRGRILSRVFLYFQLEKKKIDWI